MQSLDAALAFAITMLILSMVVTTIVETLHRIIGLRVKGLELMLGSFYDRVIAARGIGPADSDSKQAFIAMMTANRAPTGDLIGWLWRGRRLDKLGVMPFMERLGGTAFGASILNQAATVGDDAILALKDVSQKYEAFGREASVYFEARARLVSVLIGTVLALAINVNAFTLFETFMRNPNITREVIEIGSDAEEEFAALTKRVNELNDSMKAAEQVEPAGEEADSKAETQASPESRDKEVDEALTKVRQALNEAQQAVNLLKGVGVPIGWDDASKEVFSRSLWDGTWQNRTLKIRGDAASAQTGALAGLLLGGLLIGLGAPFWYNAVRGLTNLRTLSRGRDPKAEMPNARITPDASVQQPQTPVEAFAAAREAANLAIAPRPPEEPVG